MADSKISDLTALTSAAAADVLPIVDTSATATKKITITDLFTGTVFNEDGDSVDTRFEGNTKQDLLFIDGSADKVGINFDSPALRLHVVNDQASSPVYATTQCAVFEDDNRPGIQMAGSANNIALIDFGDNAASNSGGIHYKHASDAFAFVAAGDEQVSISNGVLAPITDSDVDLGTTSLRFKDTFVDSITVTGEIDGASLDIEGNADINGTTNLDVVDIDGAVDMATTLTLAGNADFNGDLDVDGTTNLDVVDIDGAVDMASTLTVAEAINGALKRWTVKTSAYTAVAGDRLLANTATTASQADDATTASFASTGDGIFSGSFSGSFIGDGRNLTGSYTVTNPTNNRVITSVDSVTGNAEANLTFDGTTLTIAGNINTGQGTTEVYLMNQNIRTSDDVSFNSITETSAFRYKENVETLDSANIIHNLRPVTFDWKDTGHKDYGLIAEEVNEHLPELVKKSDVTGEVEGIKYTKLTSLLIKVVQDQSKQIKDLTTKVNLLENKL